MLEQVDHWLLLAAWAGSSTLLGRRMWLLRGDRSRVASVIRTRHSGLIAGLLLIPVRVILLPVSSMAIVVPVAAALAVSACALLVRAEVIDRSDPG